MSEQQYTASAITILEGLEPVRKRPGMYIGGVGKEGLHHLIWEVLDNAVDEAINGFASSIHVTLEADGKTVSVEDNGRGIPVESIPQTNKVEVHSRSFYPATCGWKIRTRRISYSWWSSWEWVRAL